ncbi:MAG: hypothetical protein CM15mP113_2950 [Pseudomonadota bacterium]|nr:MAG: hypothetical protein CM15mP113_2950 [Pseudomonadota bacterium]
MEILQNFDDEEPNGSGFRAQVDEIVGIGISRIDTTLIHLKMQFLLGIVTIK